jgi:hypothetical protein
MPLRALKKSYRNQPEASPIYFLIIASSGCLQQRRQCPFFYWSKFVADGATWFSVSAEAASEGRPTVVIHAGSLENEKITVRHKDGTAKPIKVKKITVKPKIAAGMAGLKKVKKTWMMLLQQYYPNGLWGFYAGFGATFFMLGIDRIAFFADVTVKLWINFPDGDTAEDERRGHDTQKNSHSRTSQKNYGQLWFYPSSFSYRWILSCAESARTAVVFVSDYGRRPLWAVLL